MADDIKPLKEPLTIGRVLTPSEKSSLLATATSKSEWETDISAQYHDARGVRFADCIGQMWISKPTL